MSARKRDKKETAEEIEGLAFEGESRRSIAELIGVPESTIRRTAEYRAGFNKGRARRRQAIRRFQWDLLEAGNVTMAIWLGKNELGQSDKPPPPAGKPEPNVPLSMG